VDTAANAAQVAVVNNALAASPDEAKYEAELDALWADSKGDSNRYYQGVQKIAERDGLALDVLLTAFPSGAVSRAGGQYILRSQIADKIWTFNRTGSALKPDSAHRAASFLSKRQLESGKIFTITGKDGVKRTLLQTEGSFNGKKGIYEYIVDKSNNVTHQRFIEGGKITGKPNQKVVK
ncbi:MAG: hypothetical protein Q3970_01765, partial [Neisseria sp.]|nr:hypothetical protein [Neisseria sp.]